MMLLNHRTTPSGLRSVPPRPPVHHVVKRANIRCRVETTAGGTATAPAPAITLTPEAMDQLRKLRAEHPNKDALLLRVGVKQGGCSGLSYHMDFESQEKVSPDDQIMSYEDGFRLVVDPKSLLYLFGMRLGYSSALIGGGFQFNNPNATDSCGCGKSFGV